LGLFYFYKNSPKQRKGLRETMSVRIWIVLVLGIKAPTIL
jgi:hypothetical protein